MFICHRINTVEELKKIPNNYGVEVDLRDNLDGRIYIHHDPFQQGEDFENYLKHYHHKFIILNIKSEGIEFKVRDLLIKYKIKDYFFLDSSFPMIYKLSQSGEKNIALRFSEFEGSDTILNMKNKVKWIWVDCFSEIPLDNKIYNQLKNLGFKLCFVSPELQGQEEKINEYIEYIEKEKIFFDLICTKIYNIERWKKDVQIIVPMSGIGRRFMEAGYTSPKPLIIVDDKPIIEHVVNLFPGEKDIKFICNDKHLRETNMKQILKNICKTSEIFEVSVENRQGPVHAVSQIFDEIDNEKEVIVSYCDYGTVWDYQKFLQDTRERGADGSIACYKGFHPHMLGIDNYAFLQETEKESRWMSKIKEKESFTNDKISEYASNGTYYFRTGEIMKKYFKKLMDLELKLKGEYYVSLVYNLLVEDDLKVNIFEIEKMLQWGTPYDLKIYKGWSNYFSNLKKEQKPFIDKLGTTLILPMAGRGSRFSKEGYQKPKPFLDVDGKEMILQAVNCLPETKEKVFICLKQHNKDYDLEKLLSKEYSNSRIYQIESVTEGQACTCEIGLNIDNFDLEKPILISACDNGVYYDTEKYQKLVDDESNDIIVWSFRNQQTSKNNPDMYAWLDVDSEDNIKNVSCKKFIYDDPLKTHAIIGTMFFRKAKYFIEGLKNNYSENIRTNGEFYVDDVLNQNIKEGLCVKVFEVKNYICWGTPDDYKTYNYWLEYF